MTVNYQNQPIYQQQVHPAGDAHQITFSHPYGAAANIDQAWLAVRDLSTSPSGTVFEILETTFAAFDFSTSGVGVVSIEEGLTSGKPDGNYQYDIRLTGTPQSGTFSGRSETTLTVMDGSYTLEEEVAGVAETTLLLSQWEEAYRSIAAEYDARLTQYDELDTRISNLIASSGTSSSEVVDARGGFTVLRDRLDYVDDLLDGTQTGVFLFRNDWDSGDAATTPLTVQGSGNDADEAWPLLRLRNPSDGTGDSSLGEDQFDGEVHLFLQAGATENRRRYINFRRFDDSGNDWIWGLNRDSSIPGFTDAQISFDGIANTHRHWLISNGASYYAAAGDGDIKLQFHGVDSVGTGGVKIYTGGAAATNRLIAEFIKQTPGSADSATYLNLNAGDTVDRETAIYFKSRGANKYRLNHDGSGQFGLYDFIRAKYAWRIGTNGRMVIGDGTTPSEQLRVTPTVAGTTALAIRSVTDTVNVFETENAAGGVVFAVRGDGDILTNATTVNTNTPSGATARQLQLRDESGATIGYVPVYASPW